MTDEPQETPSQNPKIYCVIPAYNEEDGLPPLLAALKELFEKHERDYLLFVVNDGSKDKTREKAEEAAAHMPIEIVDHETNLNVGAVFRDGVTAACKVAQPDDVIVTLEGDNTNDPSIVVQMVDKLVAEDLNVVVASRYRKGGEFIGFPLKRRILSNGINTLMRIIYPVKGITDYSIFFRAYRARLLQRSLEYYGDKFIECPGFVSNAEMLVKARPFDLKGGEVPLLYKYDQKKGGSKMKIKKTIMEYYHFWRRVPRKVKLEQ
jgi:dolichol-phosphate mannosyltransferase